MIVVGMAHFFSKYCCTTGLVATITGNRRAIEFIALERLCCPFFGFGLGIEREGGAAWLTLTGREGVKPFIMAEIGGHLSANIQQ